MMTQEEYMNVKALHAGGWTIKQIAEHLDFHPATVSSWLKNGGQARALERLPRRFQSRRTGMTKPRCRPFEPGC